MNTPSINDAFHRALFKILAEDIEKRMTSISSGSCGDYVAYKAQVSYLEALNDVLDVCRKIEADLYGPRPGADQKQQEE